jgi:hypothetical protein
MGINDFLLSQPEPRRQLMQDLHDAIIANDKAVIPGVESMMGKEMILYKDRNFMKYGLAAVQKHMSLHVMPIYIDNTLHVKYQTLLPNAKFQKGCINFKSISEFPIAIAEQLIMDCAKMDVIAVTQKFQQDKKKKA